MVVLVIFVVAKLDAGTNQRDPLFENYRCDAGSLDLGGEMRSLPITVLVALLSLILPGCKSLPGYLSGAQLPGDDAIQIVEGPVSRSLCKEASDVCSLQHLAERAAEVVLKGGRKNLKITRSSEADILLIVVSPTTFGWNLNACEAEHLLVVAVTVGFSVGKEQAKWILYNATKSQRENANQWLRSLNVPLSQIRVAMIASDRESCSGGSWMWKKDSSNIHKRYKNEIRGLLEHR